jgi:hypothetical protein
LAKLRPSTARSDRGGHRDPAVARIKEEAPVTIPSVRSVLGHAWLLAAPMTFGSVAHADAVLDANARAAAIASTIRVTPIAVRTMALVQVSVYDAVTSISGGYSPLIGTAAAAPGASVDAAVAAATRAALLATVPAEKTAIEADYQAELSKVPEGAAKLDGIKAGESAASAVLAARSGDGADAPDAWRPRTAPGVYVPTTSPLLPQWGRRKPWVMAAGSSLRPAPPPRLDSDVWRRDLAEVAALGARNSTRRTAEQTAIARFWETSSPGIYWPVVRSVATASERTERDNARLLAEAAVAMDDALIAVFDAKYAYGFWRPITAIRNTQGSPGDSSWVPMIETPLHPEYPCAHCIVSAALGSVLEAEIGAGPSPTLRTTSPTAGGAERSWAKPAEFVREVSEARICDGVHYRNSTEVGQEMGRKIGELAERRFTAAQSARPAAK